MTTESNPANGESRLDRMERILDLLIQDHARFDEEHRKFREEFGKLQIQHSNLVAAQEELQHQHRQLLIAQVVLTDRVDKLAQTVEKLAVVGEERHKDMDERISALIKIVDVDPQAASGAGSTNARSTSNVEQALARNRGLERAL